MEIGGEAPVGRLQADTKVSPERLEWRTGRRIKVTYLVQDNCGSLAECASVGQWESHRN